MKLLLLLLASNEAFTFAAHSPDGAQQFRFEGSHGRTPYIFSYDTSGVGGGFHQEAGDALGNKRGFYGLPGRRVYYVADAGGFRASVASDEQGVDTSKDPADVVFTGSPNSGPIPPPPPSSSSGAASPGDDGLIFPPPYGGDSGLPGSGVGSDSNDFDNQDEPGNTEGNKKDVNGLEDSDGRTPAHEADAEGFRPTVESNEPGVDDAIDPVDLDVTNRRGPVGIALVFSGPPGSPPAGATLVPPGSYFGGTNGGASLPPGVPTAVGTVYRQQDGTGAYNFAYGNEQLHGPWQKVSGGSAGNGAGAYGVIGIDGRFRTVNYVAGTSGFRASVGTNEPGVEGAQGPADVVVNKSPGKVGLTPVAVDGGVQGAPGAEAAIPAAPLAPALVGPPIATARGPPSLPGVLGFPGLPGYAGFPPGSAPAIPSLGPADGYNFDNSGGAGGASHRETEDATRAKSGGNYVADAGGSRASVQSNEPGIDNSRSPADVSFGTPGGVKTAQAAGGEYPPQPQLPAIPANQGVGGPISHQGLPAPGGPPVGPWVMGGFLAPVSQNPTPGSFFYETKVFGPHHGVVNVHQY